MTVGLSDGVTPTLSLRAAQTGGLVKHHHGHAREGQDKRELPVGQSPNGKYLMKCVHFWWPGLPSC